LGEIARRAEQHCGMAVMAAGVHLAGNGGLVGNVVRLLDRERIHIGAQPDRPTALAASALAANDADHPGAADPGHHLIAAEALELLGYGAGGAMHVVEKLGMRVDVASPRG